MRPRKKQQEFDTGYSCHICKTVRGEPARALDEMVNRRHLFSSYSEAVIQSVLAYHRKLVEDELKLAQLRAMQETNEE